MKKVVDIWPPLADTDLEIAIKKCSKIIAKNVDTPFAI
jgi:hypothetical protein